MLFHPAALDDLDRAAEEIGPDFISTVERVVQRALETPLAGAPWPGLPGDLEVRRRNLPKVKFRSLAYTVIGDILWVVAIVHERRKPGYWTERLDDLPND